jgi:hypothetical protein
MHIQTRGTVGSHTGGLSPKVFNFRVNGSAVRYPTFGCIALSPSEAHQMAHDAGFNDVALTRIRDLGPREVDSFGQFYLTESPYLGAQWMPLAQAIHELGVRLPYEKTFVVQVLSAENEFSDEGSPFVQFLLRGDGSLRQKSAPAATFVNAPSPSRNATCLPVLSGVTLTYWAPW